MPSGARQEPHVEVRATVAPAIEVNPATSPSPRIARSTRATIGPNDAATSGGRSLKESACSRLAIQTARKAAADRRVHGPLLVRPDSRGRRAAADAAGLAAGLTTAWWLGMVGADSSATGQRLCVRQLHQVLLGRRTM